MTGFGWQVVLFVLAGVMLCAPAVQAGHFSAGAEAAVKIGVHEVLLTGNDRVANHFGVVATVRFTPPSGAARATTVWAFYDGDNNWRARVYASETGGWTWSSSCAGDPNLNG